MHGMRKIAVVMLLLGRLAPAADESPGCRDYLNGDFAIENVFPDVKIQLDGNGVPIIPRGRAFTYWRERALPSVPDTAFAWHYLKDGQEKKAAIGVSMAAAQEEASSLPPWTGILYDDEFFTRLKAAGLLYGIELPVEFRRPLYILFEQSGKVRIAVFPHKGYTHQVAWRAMGETASDIRFIVGGMMSLLIDEDPQMNLPRFGLKYLSDTAYCAASAQAGSLPIVFRHLQERLSVLPDDILELNWTAGVTLGSRYSVAEWRKRGVLP